MDTNQEKIEFFAKFWTELAENKNGVTSKDYSHYKYPIIDLDITRLKNFKVNPPKPKVKKIDLSIVITSQIDMEFGLGLQISKLKAIQYNATSKYVSTNDNLYEQCRVRQDTWHSWQGGECPIPEGLVIAYQHVNSYYQIATMHNIGKYDDGILDWKAITAFKITGTADGWG